MRERMRHGVGQTGQGAARPTRATCGLWLRRTASSLLAVWLIVPPLSPQVPLATPLGVLRPDIASWATVERQCWGQEPLPGAAGESDDSPEALARRAYQLTRTAKTIADYEAVIVLCEAVRQRPALPATVQYADQLAAWALNRRGEERLATASREGNEELEVLALADFQAAIERDATRWKAWLNRGVARGTQGELAGALSDFERVVALNPKSPEGWFNLGELHFQQAQWETAEREYSRFLELSPKDQLGWVRRATVRLQLGRVTETLSDFQRAIAIAPREASVYVARADALQHLKRWAEAASDYRHAIQLQADSASAYQGAAWLMSTCPEARFRDRRRALEAAGKALRLAGQRDYRLLDILAAAEANDGQYARAVQTLGEALQAAPPLELAGLRHRLELYRRQQPYRQTTDRQTTERQTTERQPAGPAPAVTTAANPAR